MTFKNSHLTKKSLFLTFLLLFFLVIGIVPYILGYSIEKNFLHMVNNLPKTSKYTLTVQSYHRDWFCSDVRLQATFSPVFNQQQSKSLSKLSFNIHEKIWHGPFIFAHNGEQKWFLDMAYLYALGKVSLPTQTHQLAIQDMLSEENNYNTILMTFNKGTQLNIHLALSEVPLDIALHIKSIDNANGTSYQITIPKATLNILLKTYFYHRHFYFLKQSDMGENVLTTVQLNKLVDSKIKSVLHNWEIKGYVQPEGDDYRIGY